MDVLGVEVVRSGSKRELRARVYFQHPGQPLSMVRLYSKSEKSADEWTRLLPTGTGRGTRRLPQSLPRRPMAMPSRGVNAGITQHAQWSLVQECSDLLLLCRHLHGCQWRWSGRLLGADAPFGLSAGTGRDRDLADAVPTFSRKDDGYDITDYYGVDPRFGTLRDFVEFTHGAKLRGIRVIIDLVVNHTSDQHPWFQAARADPGSHYHDWYVWSDMVFPGVQKTTWTRDAKARKYYFHRFYEHQPDLPTSLVGLPICCKMHTCLLRLTGPLTFSPAPEASPCALSPKDDSVHGRLKKRQIDSQQQQP
jgi:hypothetical protein